MRAIFLLSNCTESISFKLQCFHSSTSRSQPFLYKEQLNNHFVYCWLIPMYIIAVVLLLLNILYWQVIFGHILTILLISKWIFWTGKLSLCTSAPFCCFSHHWMDPFQLAPSSSFIFMTAIISRTSLSLCFILFSSSFLSPLLRNNTLLQVLQKFLLRMCTRLCLSLFIYFPLCKV